MQVVSNARKRVPVDKYLAIIIKPEVDAVGHLFCRVIKI